MDDDSSGADRSTERDTPVKQKAVSKTVIVFIVGVEGEVEDESKHKRRGSCLTS